MQVNKLNKILKAESKRLGREVTLETLEDGEYADGGGLYYIVYGKRRAWQFRYKLPGQKQRKKTFETIRTIEAARVEASRLSGIVDNGKDPFEAQGTTAAAITRTGAVVPTEFQAFAHVVLGMRSFKNDVIDPITGLHVRKPNGNFKSKSRQGWAYSIDTVCKSLHGKQLVDIGRPEVTAALSPIWKTTSAIARETVKNLKIIFEIADDMYGKIMGFAPDWTNPSSLKSLERALGLLPKKGTIKKSHASISYREIPQLWCELRAIDSVSSKALQVVILTCLRVNEALASRKEGWLKKAKFTPGALRWDIPGKVMKHKDNIPGDIPLVGTVLEIIDEVSATTPADQPFVFPSLSGKKKLSDDALLKMLQRRMGYNGKGDLPKVTTHGMRATFVGWCRDTKSGVDREVRQYCLHHIEGSEAENAYLSGDMFDKRLEALTAWETYVTSEERRRLELEQPVELQVAA